MPESKAFMRMSQKSIVGWLAVHGPLSDVDGDQFGYRCLERCPIIQSVHLQSAIFQSFRLRPHQRSRQWKSSLPSLQTFKRALKTKLFRRS